jgi:hypothetical protein
VILGTMDPRSQVLSSVVSIKVLEGSSVDSRHISQLLSGVAQRPTVSVLFVCSAGDQTQQLVCARPTLFC